MSGRSLEDWLAYISAQHPSIIAMGLDRVHAVAGRMGVAVIPAEAGIQPATITVGGTNGKGSTCAYLESILSNANSKTDLYTSPHLMRYNERVRMRCGEV